MWAEVAQACWDWAIDTENILREQDALKQKFDFLANTQKKTGDPSCPPHVRRAKHIARAILGRAQVACLGGDDDDDMPNTTYLQHPIELRLGERVGELRPGALGIKRKPSTAESNHALLQIVSRVADKFETMADSVTNNDVQDVVNLVKVEVASALSDTQDSIEQLKKIITELGNKMK